MKRTLTALLLFTALCAAVFAQTEADFATEKNKSGGITITRYNGSAKNVIIPAIIKGVKVTEIGEKCFYIKENISSVTIPDGVTSIGGNAFDDCTSLTNVTIPNSVTSIGNWAFSGCTNLTSVTIPNSVTSIGNGAFASCTSLTAINVDTANTAYSLQDGVLYNKDKTTLIQYPAGKTGSSFTIPNRVISIRGGAFSGCTSLTSVTIPNSVTIIEANAFSGCTSLESVTFAPTSKVNNIGNYAFNGCRKLNSVTIPNSVTSIGVRAFYYCEKLVSVTIPDGVTSIGWWAFYGCDSLTSVTFATGSNIADASFGDQAFPEEYGLGGNALKTAYSTGKAGTYTRAANGDTWAKK